MNSDDEREKDATWKATPATPEQRLRFDTFSAGFNVDMTGLDAVLADDRSYAGIDRQTDEMGPPRSVAPSLADISRELASEYQGTIAAAVRRQAALLNADLYAPHYPAEYVPSPPPTRWQRLRWWWQAKRERLGELVAGRRFDDAPDSDD